METIEATHLMRNFLSEVLLPMIAGGTGGVALVALLSKKLLEHRLKKDLEQFKSILAFQTSLAQEVKNALFKMNRRNLKSYGHIYTNYLPFAVPIRRNK